MYPLLIYLTDLSFAVNYIHSFIGISALKTGKANNDRQSNES